MPILAMRVTESSQSTDEGSWRTKDAGISPAFTIGLASALLINGMRKSDQVIAASSFANRSAAFCMSGV
jgi:hypothetical protein